MPPALQSAPLSAEDLSFWYSDQPRQRTTMAMLMLLDRRPDPERLAGAATRMVEAVPRLRQRVVDSPFDLEKLLPPGTRIVDARGVRIATPTARVMQVPQLRRWFRSAEQALCDSPLRVFGGFYIAAIRREH